ncbi:MAG: metalloregulator ArsR/SmtB family transcription factor [Dehalococcoidia bacterium]
MSTAAALADPVRVEILSLLRTGPLTAGGIAGHFSISRPAISRHLRVLRDAGLVLDERAGRERYYRLETAPLRELAAWLQQFLSGVSWETRLDALETEVWRTSRDRRATRKEHTA